MNNDLISREALKDEVRKYAKYYADRTEEDRYNVGYTECACEILDFIDNAPPVETFTLEDMQNNFDLGAMSEVGKHDRPKGVWVYNEKLNMYFCKDCGLLEPLTKEEVEEGCKLPNFCQHYGADMQKGGAEE